MTIRGLRWYIAALLFLATVINYVDRQALSVVAPALTRELGLSPVEYATILQAFLYAYTVMYVVSGLIVDRWGTRLSLAAFMAWWSIANMLHALASGAFGLGVFRFLLGIGEPGNFMAAAKAASEWYPPRERAFVNGLVQAGAAVGAIVSAPLIVWLYLRYGWRAAFVLTGAAGLVWLAGWLLLYRAPERHPWLAPAELETIRGPERDAAARDQGPSLRWRDLLRLPQTWGLVGARFLSSPVWWFYLFWLPKYLVERRGFSMAEMAALAWMPYLAADLGSILGGLASGGLVKRGWAPERARRAVMTPAALLMPLSAAVAWTPSAALALAAICVVTFAHMAWMTNLATVTNDLYPRRVVGSAAGLAAFGNGLGGALFTWLTGHIVQGFGYDAIFVVMAFLHPAALVLFRVLVRGPVAARAVAQ